MKPILHVKVDDKKAGKSAALLGQSFKRIFGELYTVIFSPQSADVDIVADNTTVVNLSCDTSNIKYMIDELKRIANDDMEGDK